jgi:Protein of unknown function (DUF2867)
VTAHLYSALPSDSRHGRAARAPRSDTGKAYAVPLPRTPFLARALLHVDWSDAYAVATPVGARGHHPQEWADAIFRSPPLAVRILFSWREALVRAVGIESGGRHVFDTVSWNTREVLLGVDQQHLAFRASVLVEADRVVLSTVVDVRNRRGRAYSALVRRVHPFVVRTLLSRAARTMATPVDRPRAQVTS